MRRPPLITANKGFTIAESMIVLAVLGILVALAAPSFNEIIQKQRAKNAAADLHAALTRARSEAIKRSTNITLAPKSGNWASGWQISISGTVVEDHDSVSNLSISGPSGGVIYRSSGRISSTTAVSFGITGTYASATRYICLDLSGRPSVQTSACPS